MANLEVSGKEINILIGTVAGRVRELKVEKAEIVPNRQEALDYIEWMEGEIVVAENLLNKVLRAS